MPRKRPNKRPRVEFEIPDKKIPRVPSEDDSFFCWSTNYADLSDREWGWGRIDLPYFFREIVPKLTRFGEFTWKELIGNNLVHFHSFDGIDKEAQKRLKELVDNGVIPEDWYGEDLTSIHFTGRKRIWGIKDGKRFHLLWWDPDHSVYPVRKKHT